MHQRRPDIGLIPLLRGTEVGGRNTTAAGIEIGRDALIGVEDGVGVVLEMLRRSTSPEGVELSDAEEDLLALRSSVPVNGISVVVSRVEDVLGVGCGIEVKVAPESLIPHESRHSVAAVGSYLTPLLTSAAVASLFVKVGDGNLVAIENGVEVDRNDVVSVEISKGKVVVFRSVFRASDPSSSVVPTTLGTAGEVRVEFLFLCVIEALFLGIDDARCRIVGLVVSGPVVLAVGLWSRYSVGDIVAEGGN